MGSLEVAYDGGVYVGGEVPFLVKQQNFVFSDGAEGSFYIITDVNSMVLRLKSAATIVIFGSILTIVFTASILVAWLYQGILMPLNALKKAGINVENFAYPNNRRNEDTDRTMFQYYRYLRAGIPGGTKGKDLRQLDALYRTLSDVRSNRVMGGAGIGSYYETDPEQLKGAIIRAAKENKIVTFFSHGISDNPNFISISTEWLELILKTAQEHGVKVIGFDELD